MKQLMFILAVSLVFMGCQSGEQTAANEVPAVPAVLNEETAELLINLTSDVRETPESALMALHFALKARENDIPVTVFLNVKGVHLASQANSEVVFHDENLQDLLQQIVTNGGTVVACPMCMEVQGISESDLAEGVVMSSPGLMMQKLKDGPTVFTY